MRLKFILISFIIITILGLTSPLADRCAEIQFIEKTYDHGDINQDTIIYHEFEFKNTGSCDLIIKNVKSPCDCHTPEWSTDPIPPDSTGVIISRFNTKGKLGKQHKCLNVESNAKNWTEYICIKAKVIRRP